MSENIKYEVEKKITEGDVEYIERFVHNFSFIPSFANHSRYLVDFAYSNNQLAVAATLVNNGGIFDIKSLFLTNSFSNDYASHIEVIKDSISTIQYNSAMNLAKSFKDLDPIIINPNETFSFYNGSYCIDTTKYMSYYTASNAQDSTINGYYESLQSNSSNLIKQIVNAVIGISYDQYSKFIVMPVGTRTYFDAVSIKRDGQANIIYLPINDNNNIEHSYSYHELSHYIFYGMPKFNGCAYFDNTSRKAYEKASKETLLNILSIFGINVKDYDTIINKEWLSVRYVVNWIDNHTDISLFTSLDGLHDDRRTDLLTRKYITNNYIPPLNGEILLSNFLQSYMRDKNISQDQAYLLARIGEFIKRSDDEFCNELIVRLPELEAYGLDSEVLALLKPLKDYWEKYISPKIEEVIEHLPVPLCGELLTCPNE